MSVSPNSREYKEGEDPGATPGQRERRRAGRAAGRPGDVLTIKGLARGKSLDRIVDALRKLGLSTLMHKFHDR